MQKSGKYSTQNCSARQISLTIFAAGYRNRPNASVCTKQKRFQCEYGRDTFSEQTRNVKTTAAQRYRFVLSSVCYDVC